MSEFNCGVGLIYGVHVFFKFCCGSCPYYMNLFHVWMWFGARLIRCSSNLPINKFAYAGAILVPMAVP